MGGWKGARCLALKPLVSCLRYASQVIHVRSQYLYPGGYPPLKVIQGNTITSLCHRAIPGTIFTKMFSRRSSTRSRISQFTRVFCTVGTRTMLDGNGTIAWAFCSFKRSSHISVVSSCCPPTVVRPPKLWYTGKQHGHAYRCRCSNVILH